MTALSLGGERAIITGASGGIGHCIAETLIEAGARVWSVDLPGGACAEGAERMDCDLSDAAAIERALHDVLAAEGRIEHFVHCAGITRDAVLWKLSPEDWAAVQRVNLDAAFHFLRLLAPAWREGEGGSAVLISSINGERGKFGQANYAASKAGLIALARTAARELGRSRVRVNAIAPGLIRTKMTESLPEDVMKKAIQDIVLGKAGEPQDVANAVLFLCSSLSSHITGQVLRVDGGQLMA